VPDRYGVWLDRDVIEVTGPESGSFLQGQLSQDTDGLDVGGSAWSWVLAPTGKVDALVRITRAAEDRWLLDTDRGWGDALLSRLNRFKLRTKAELASVPWKVLGLRGEGVATHAGTGRADAGGAVVAAWPGVPGVDVLGASVEVPEGFELIDAAAYEAIRIASGIPRMGAELTDKTIPAETGLIDLTVSFTKGCYTGQELVARIDSRGGHVPRHLRGLAMAEGVEPGTDLESEGKVVGTVTSAAAGPDGRWVGLGYVRRGSDPPLTVAVSGAPDVKVEVLELRR
jgi:tRNA-modifying protein YgfZ